jgi:membrane-associated protein
VLHSVVTAGLLDPSSLLHSSGPWGVLLVCAVIFAETGLLVGFFFPGDTLLFFTGLLTFSGVVHVPLWLSILLVIVAATAGAQLGYLIGRAGGPAVFERRETGFFSRSSVVRTHQFFDRFGALSVTLARFVPVVRTFAPVAAGIAKMPARIFFLYNIAGAVLWSTALILIGYYVGHLPGVAAFVSNYIDIVLIAIVVVSIVPALARVLITRRRAAKHGATGSAADPM